MKKLEYTQDVENLLEVSLNMHMQQLTESGQHEVAAGMMAGILATFELPDEVKAEYVVGYSYVMTAIARQKLELARTMLRDLGFTDEQLLQLQKDWQARNQGESNASTH